MAFTYNIEAQKTDNTSSKCLLGCHTLTGIINTFVSTFLVAYIYQTDQFKYIFNVGVYYLACYLTFFVTYTLFSAIVDKTNRIWVYRLGILFKVSLVLVLVFFGQSLAKLLILAGFLYGLSESCYYASFNVLKEEMVSRKVMGTFATLITILNNIVNIIVPVTLGALIHISTYTQVSIYIAIIGIAILTTTFWIKAQKPANSDYHLIEYYKKLKEPTEVNKKIKFLYYAAFAYGFCSPVSQVLNISIVLMFNGSSLSLGWLTSLVAVLQTITIILVSKYTKISKRSWLFYIAIAMPIIVAPIFAFAPSIATLIIYDLGMGFSSVLYNTIYDIHRNGNLKEAGYYDYIAEHHTTVENTLNFCRVISYTLVILISLLKKNIAFYIMLLILSLSYSILLTMIAIYEKKYAKPAISTTETSAENEIEKEKSV